MKYLILVSCILFSISAKSQYSFIVNKPDSRIKLPEPKIIIVCKYPRMNHAMSGRMYKVPLKDSGLVFYGSPSDTSINIFRIITDSNGKTFRLKAYR